MASGAPCATMRPPPPSPPSGPKSTIQSVSAMLSRLCSITTTGLPVSTRRCRTRSAQGTIRYALKPPYRDGTTHVIFEPLDFLARLASLVGRHDPRSQAMIRRKHPVVTRQVHSRTRHQFGRTKPTQKEARAAPRHVAMSWAQRLKRVFDIDIETCEHCGGTLKIISVLRTRS